MDGHRLWRLWKPCEKHALMVHKRLSCAGGFDCRQTLLRTEVNFVLPCTTQYATAQGNSHASLSSGKKVTLAVICLTMAWISDVISEAVFSGGRLQAVLRPHWGELPSKMLPLKCTYCSRLCPARLL